MPFVVSLSNHERPFDKPALNEAEGLRANGLLRFSHFSTGGEEELSGARFPSPIIVGFVRLHFRYRLLSTLSPVS